VPFTVTAQAVVWPPDDAQLRPEIDGFIAGVRATSGEQVEAGQVVLELSDPVLLAARSGLLSRFSGLRAEQYDAILQDPVRALNAEKQIERTQAELERAEQRIAGLQVRSKVTGRLVLPRPEDLRDGFAHRGALMGYVLTPGSVNVRAVVSGEDAPLIRASAQRAEVRLAERPGALIEAQIVRDMPAASASLPTAALGERAGGALRTDPLDKSGMRALEPFFQFDLMLAGDRLERIGGRAWVRFDLGSAPLAVQAYRRLSQLLLRHVNPDV
jgi:putative peptide zinc metalloprotease protein